MIGGTDKGSKGKTPVSTPNCAFCGDVHFSSSCQKVTDATTRVAKVKENKLCLPIYLPSRISPIQGLLFEGKPMQVLRPVRSPQQPMWSEVREKGNINSDNVDPQSKCPEVSTCIGLKRKHPQCQYSGSTSSHGNSAGYG